MGELLDAALDVAVGRVCAGCGRPGRQLCPGCAAVMAGWTPGPSSRPGLAWFMAATPYAGQAARLLVAHKDRGAVALSRPLGRVLARSVLAVLDVDPRAGRVLLVPVPSSAAARRRRGYDHTLRLARAAARDLRHGGVDARAAPLLVRRRVVRDQAELDVVQRRANQHGSMQVGVRGRRTLSAMPGETRLVVVDDIVTTGATVCEAVRVLGEALWAARADPLGGDAGAGAGRGCIAGVAAVAQTPRRHAGWAP